MDLSAPSIFIKIGNQMKFEILINDAKNSAAKAKVKYLVQSGQKITVVVDGVMMTGAQTPNQKKIELTRVANDLVIETQDGAEKLAELNNFYVEEDVLLTGNC